MHNTNIKRRRYSRGLRDACRSAFAAALMLLSFGNLHAQNFPNGLSADSVNPSDDSANIARMRERMDVIHRKEHRPTVALVLSGGGAKGAAHIGVLRKLEEMNIPIDLICGTSIGSLIGAMYSLGYDSRFIETTVRSLDWSKMLSDKIDQCYVPYSTKMERETYFLKIPFNYTEEDFSARIDDDKLYSNRDGMLHVGASQDGFKEPQYGVNSLMNSLPSGYVYGLNVNNFISSLTVGYQDSLDFRNLPIPFYCVATDVISCKAKNWGNGSLKDAMRSSMSIPGLFDPVRTEGMVLVDGGTRNNFPVDIARAMGADFVIGVDLSDLNPSYSMVNNIGSILSQFIVMLGQDSFQNNKKDVDVFIKPEISEYNMLSFNDAAIDCMIGRGYEAACRNEAGLREIKRYVGEAKTIYHNRKAVDINRNPVQLSSVEFKGLSDKESRLLHRKVKLDAGEWVNAEDLSEAVSKIQATGAFESVNYSLYGSQSPYRLVFNCIKSPTHVMRMGFRADSEELVGMLFNVGFNTHKLMGSKLDITAKVGVNAYADIRYALDIPSLPTINADVRVSTSTARLLMKNTSSAHKDLSLTASFWGHRERIYFSDMHMINFDLQLGAKNRFFIVPEALNAYLYSAEQGRNLKTDFAGVFANGVLYTMDNKSYPSKGVNMRLDAQVDLFSFVHTDVSYKPVSSISFDFKGVIPFGSRFAIIPDIHLRSKFNFDDQSLIHTNFIGGPIADRYIEGQVPFVGMNNVYMAKDHMLLLNLDLRARFFKNVYASLLGGWMRDGESYIDPVKGLKPSVWGAGLELGYNSLLGPIKLNAHWSSLNNAMGYYLSVGFDF